MTAALVALVAAQSLTVCADRPGKASPTCIVPTGHVQLEVGLADWTLANSAGERDTALTIGQVAVKYGLTAQSHVAVVVTPLVRATSRAQGRHDEASGFGDVQLVYKHLLTAADAPLQLAVSPFVKAPTAKRPLGNRKWEGGLVIPIQYTIGNTPLTLALTPELDWAADGDGRGRHAVAANVVNLGWQATPQLNLSAELWGQWNLDPAGTERQVSADIAASWLATRRVQLDIGANFGLNRATPDADLYLGVSRLF
jgi:hypothetical protein